MNSPKYQSIIKTGKELFWKYGIKRVTIEEVCRESGVSKMTFYKFFSNKTDLVKTILDDLFETSIANFNTIINKRIPFSKKLEQMFLMKLNSMKDISVEFINDIHNNPESGLLEYMAKHRKRTMNLISKFYKNAQKNGNIRKEVKIDFIQAYSNQVLKLMEDKELMKQYNKPEDFVLEVMNLLFYGIVTKND